MTPREGEQMTPAEYRAFVRYANQEIKTTERAARRRRR